MKRFSLPWLAAAGLLLLSGPCARAAGGHFDVDDAAVLEPGHCQYETWFARAPAAGVKLFHLGPGCRVGPVEIGLNYDRLSTARELRDSLGPQLKWVTDLWADRLATGVAWAAAFDLRRGGRSLHTLYLPLSWTASTRLAFNANLGADWDADGARTRRVGISGEWGAHERVSVIGERVKFGGDWTSRLGARLNLSGSVSVDLSAARVGPRAARVYVIGLNHDFAR